MKLHTLYFILYLICFFLPITFLIAISIYTGSEVDYLNEKLGRLEMCGRTFDDYTLPAGFHKADNYISVWIEGKTVDEVYEIVWHELAHMNISLDKKSKSTSLFINESKRHFCK